jgi:hypothetical protein
MTHKLAAYENLMLADIIALLDHRNLGFHITSIAEATRAVAQVGEVAITQRSFSDDEMCLVGLEPVEGARALEVDEDRYSFLNDPDLTREDSRALQASLSVKLLAHYSAAKPDEPDAPTQA